MGRAVFLVAAGVVLGLGAGAVYVYGEITSFRVDSVTEDVDVIYGRGGNVGVLATGEGAVVVDTMAFRLQGDQIRELAERISGQPVIALFNTHYHWDHTHGNPAFPAGTRVVATRRTRDLLLRFDADSWQGAAAETAPNDLFDDEYELELGGKTVRAYHFGRGHTSGDLVVLFVEDRVLHAGDLFFHGRYPRIDLAAGGSVRAWVETLDRVLELDFEHVIPGHGAVSDRQGLVAFQRFLRQLWGLAERAAREGRTLDETLAMEGFDADAGYDAVWIPFLARADRETVIRSAWKEATEAVEAGSRDTP